MTDRLLTSGKLASRAGVTPDTLRYYERLGLLPVAHGVLACIRIDLDLARREIE